MSMVSPGATAPSFELPGASPEGEIHPYSLEELIGDTWLILSVYAYDFSPVCVDQLCSTTELEWLTLRDDVTVVGISSDGPYSHRRFAQECDISYPLLSDTGLEVCADYDAVTSDDTGTATIPRRSVFLVDPDRRVRYRWTAANNWNRWDNGPLWEIKAYLEEDE
jgi:peroxiredoxin